MGATRPHNTHAIHIVGFKPRSYRIRRLNGIHEVGGSSPLGSTKGNTKGPARAGPFAFVLPRKVTRGSSKFALVIHVQYTHNTHAYIASMARRSSSMAGCVYVLAVML